MGGLIFCVRGFINGNIRRATLNKGCGELEPTCSRCQTNEPMSNTKPGCLLEIYKGDNSSDACKLLDYSSGRYPRQWFRSGKAITCSMAIVMRPSKGRKKRSPSM